MVKKSVGLKSVGEKYMLESLWVKNPWGKNRGRWDAGFRSPFSGLSSKGSNNFPGKISRTLKEANEYSKMLDAPDRNLLMKIDIWRMAHIGQP